MTPSSASLADDLVQFVTDADTRESARPHLDVATLALVDTLACVAAGSNTIAPTVVYDALRPHGTGSTSVVGRAPLGLLDAVLVNATAAHALDFDDTIQGLTTHPSCHLVPALLALTPVADVSGSDLLISHLVGLQVEHWLAAAASPDHYRRGWHTTGTIGTVAAAAATSHLLRLSPDQTRVALSAAASSAAGLRANFGSMVKPVHAGHAARAGLESALLARAGLSATSDALTHRFGFFPAAVGRAPDVTELDPGAFPVTQRLAFKPYPCCGEAIGAVQAAIALSERFAVPPDAEVEVRLGPFAREILEFDRPQNPDQARFSAPYCVWKALTSGALPPSAFDEAVVSATDVAELDGHFRTVVDETLGHERAAVVSVRVNGHTWTERVTVPRGDPSIGFDETDVRRKFLTCVTEQPQPDALALVDEVLGLEAAGAVDDFIARLAASS